MGDRASYDLFLDRAAAGQHTQKGQGRLSLKKVVAQVFSGLRDIAGIVKDIVDQLKGGPQTHPELGHAFTGGVRRSRDHGTRPAGDPSRQEQLAMYEAHSGRPAVDVHFHTVFAGARYSAIVVRVMNRLVARGDLGEDNTIWLNNPAADALADIVADRGQL